jgi:hypothetical protein
LTHSYEFEILGKFGAIFETTEGYHSERQVGYSMKRKSENLLSVSLYTKRRDYDGEIR